MKKLLLLLCLQVYATCIAQKDSVVYENLGATLILYNDSTFVYKNKGIDIAPLQGIGDDTISYGKYIKYKNKSFYLFSHPDIMSQNLKMTVEEKHVNSIKDSIKIIVSSPFTVQRNLFPKLLNDAYFYMIKLQYDDGEKEITSPQWFLCDTMMIYSKRAIQEIHLYIYPYPYKNFSLSFPYFQYLYTTYSLKEHNSNYFNLYIPQFTACYIYYKRFNAQEVEILDKCTISINKKILLSKCKGKRFNKEWKYIVFERKNPYCMEDDYY